MTKQELETLNGLFSKKANLESRLNEINFPTTANFELKSVAIQVEYRNNDGNWVKHTLKTFPILHKEVKHYFMREKNRIMIELFDINHQIEKVKITK